MRDQLRDLATEILRALERSGFTSRATDLKVLLERLESPDPSVRRGAAEDIKDRCHPRRFGDLNIQDYGIYEWWNMLGRLERLAERRAARDGTPPSPARA